MDFTHYRYSICGRDNVSRQTFCRNLAAYGLGSHHGGEPCRSDLLYYKVGRYMAAAHHPGSNYNRFFFGLRALPLPLNLRLSFGYLITALAIAIPIVGYLSKTKWHNASDIAYAFSIFGVAVLFRVIDKKMDLAFFWMGTHWLWHLFGGLAVFSS